MDTHSARYLRDALVSNTTEMDLLSNKLKALLTQENILHRALHQRIVDDDAEFHGFLPLPHYGGGAVFYKIIQQGSRGSYSEYHLICVNVNLTPFTFYIKKLSQPFGDQGLVFRAMGLLELEESLADNDDTE